MLRVAAYCRVSTDKDDQANSFASQQRYFRECIERHPDWVLQEIYADEGLSGTSTKKRQHFNCMIQAAREGKIDLIITKEVSRFARNTVDTLAYTRELRRRGVGVIFLLDNISTLDTDGELRLTIMSSIAQEESRKTSERVKWGQTQRMKEGIVFGRSLLGYDVVEGQITIEPKGAETVKYIFHKYLNERKGAGTIARELRSEGICSSRGNLKWSASTVLKILKNEKYCGDLIQKKTYTPDYLSHEKKYNKGQEERVVLYDHHQPIIDRMTWEAVQNELSRRSRSGLQKTGHGNHYPLSGKIKCGHCGSSFVSRTRKTKAGEAYRVWRCGRAVAEGKNCCPMGRQIREDTAIAILKQTIDSVPLDCDQIIHRLTQIIITCMENCASEHHKEVIRFKQELKLAQGKKQRVLESYLDNVISQADFQFMNQCCDAKIEQLYKQLNLASKVVSSHEQDIYSATSEIVNGFCAPDSFYGQLLHCMTVFQDGRVEVVLKDLPNRWEFIV